MRTVATFVVSLAFLAVPALAQAPAQIDCVVVENGKAGSGSFTVSQGGQQITKGSCGRPAPVPAGDYEVVVALDGAVDAPVQREKTSARGGQTAQVRGRFETGELLIEVMRGGRRGVATVRLLKGEATVATLSAGVVSRVSTGTYAVEVESRGDKRRFDGVAILSTERRTIAVDFGK
jgi:hypothetical protein